MDLVQKIQLNLAMVRLSLVNGIARILERGETAERIEAMAKVVAESGKAFEIETEKRVSTPWQRCCGKGRWIQWVCPCIPLWHWSGAGERLNLWCDTIKGTLTGLVSPSSSAVP